MNTYIVKDIIQALVDGDIDILPQGCNCFCEFGKVLAELIAQRFPEAVEADCKTTVGDVSKLGTITVARVLDNKYIVNCYTQYHWIKALNNEPKIKKNGRKVVLLADYVAIEKSMQAIINRFPRQLKIGVPKIGAGYANGDWSVIEKIIERTLIAAGFNVTFYVISDKEIPA